MNEITRSKLKLAALLLMVVVPITLASFAFRSAMEGGGLFGSANHGNLILPPLDITALDMRDEVSGAPLFRPFEEVVAELGSPDDYVPRPWMMVFATTEACDAACEDRIFYLRQLHTRLGRERERVQRYYLHARDVPLAEATRAHLAQEHPDMALATASAATLARQLNEGGVALDLQADSYVFLVDPLGNVMMYYDSTHTTQQIMDDIQHLLKYSSLG